MSGIPAGAGQLLGKRLGKFEIVALLALGGTAEIYLARIGGAAGFEKYVVVKCLHDHLADDAEFVKMFLDEARLAAHLDHSNIVQTMELGQYDGRYYMVMEFLAGLSLAMVVRRVAERLPDTRIPVPLVLNILAQSCAGLHYAHEKAMNGKALNIVHRDISPQNLVVSFEGVVKLVDFGIAKAEMRETRTRSGTIKGKFAYMSPEQCTANNVDRRTDVFALGVIGHELLTGRRLFKRPSPYETYQAVMECDVKPPSTIDGSAGDPALDQVIMGALTKDKLARYPTAEAFGDALLGYLHHRGVGSGPGDVARFFDAHFAQEIEEHSARMRELISGRDIAVEAGVTWGVDDPDEDAKRERAEDSARRFVLSVGGVVGSFVDRDGSDEGNGGSAGMGSSLFDDLGGGSRVEDDDEMPAEPTRIESNPLERVNELERLAASAPKAKPTGSGRMPAAGAPPPTTNPPSSIAGIPSGRFPDLANLPTVIAESDHPVGVPPAVTAFANAPTGPAPSNGPAVETASANAPTGLASPIVPPAAPAPTVPPHSVPPPVSRFANAQTKVAPPSVSQGPGLAIRPSPPDHGRTQLGPPPGGFPGDPGRGSMPGLPGMPPAHPPRAEPNGTSPPGAPGPRLASASSPPPASIASGYPVLNAELSAQIATGATVFPSDHRPPPAAPAGAKPGPPPASYPGPRIEPSPRDGYPVRPPDSGPRDSVPFDPQRAASLMSPVGQHYPESVDWDAAAALPARAVPPWLLALLFIGALGVALAVTIVIARLVS